MNKAYGKAAFFLTAVILLGTQTAAASLSSQLGATKLDGLDKFNECMNESYGYREKLIADRLELKLANSPAVPPEERGQWLAEINALRRVYQERRPFQAPNPSKPQQHLLGLTGPEQQAINSEFARFSQEVHLKCEKTQGGMLRYNGAGTDMSSQTRYEDSLRAKMTQVIPVSSIPVEPLPSLTPKSPEQLEAERRAADQAQIQAGKQAAAQMTNACMNQTKGLRIRIMVQRLQDKLNAAAGLSEAERQAFQEDVQAAWMSAGKGLDTIEPVDPRNNFRAEQRLTQQDHLDINNEFMQQNMQIMQGCIAAQTAQMRART